MSSPRVNAVSGGTANGGTTSASSGSENVRRTIDRAQARYLHRNLNRATVVFCAKGKIVFAASDPNLDDTEVVPPFRQDHQRALELGGRLSFLRPGFSLLSS